MAEGCVHGLGSWFGFLVFSILILSVLRWESQPEPDQSSLQRALAIGTEPTWLSLEADVSLDLAWGDIDGDGDLDLAVANVGVNRLYLNHNGTLSTTSSWNSSDLHDSYSLAWGDLDNDGDLDLVVGNRNYFNVIYYNLGQQLEVNPSWTSMENNATRAVSLGDVDGDGDLDLAVGNWAQPNQIYLNTNGVLENVSSWNSSDMLGTFSIAWGDEDGDGYPELAAANGGNSNLVYRNSNGNLEQTASWQSVFADSSRSLVWGDVDGDGDLDLAVANENQPDRIYFNNFGLLTGPGWSSSSATPSRSIGLADMDSDGDLDLIVGTDGGQTLIYQNDAGIAISPSWNSSSTSRTFAVAAADLDRDGDLELATATVGVVNELYLGSALLFPQKQLELNLSAPVTVMIWGDADGDGFSDLVTGGEDGEVHLYRNSGSGLLLSSPVWNVTLSAPVRGLSWGDVDGDQRLDLAVALSGAADLIFLNSLSGLIASPWWISPLIEESEAIAFGDVDADGDPDMVVGTSGINHIYLNINGTLALLPYWNSTEGDDTRGVAWGDVDGDDDLDLVVVNDGQPDRIYQNVNGSLENGSFWNTSLTDSSVSLALGDIDGDGGLDLVTGNRAGSNRLYLNNGTGLSTTPSWDTPEMDTTRSVTLADDDGDGDLDLFVGNSNQSDRIYRNNGTGLEYVPYWNSSLAEDTRQLISFDVDLDGDMDLISSTYEPTNISVSLRSVGTVNHLPQVRPSPFTSPYPDAVNHSGQYPFTYLITDKEENRAHLKFHFSDHFGGPWREASEISNGEGTISLRTDNTNGVIHTFTWDLEADGVMEQKAYLRVSVTGDTGSGPIQLPPRMYLFGPIYADYDKDRDGLSNLIEKIHLGTDLNDSDSDGGGTGDGIEVLQDMTDPLDPGDDITDHDLDGYEDIIDAFPGDPTQWNDTDGDGFGDAQNGTNPDGCLSVAGFSSWPLMGCPDFDGDGVMDSADAFPTDATQTNDTDGDGYGDNANGNQSDGCPSTFGTSEWPTFGCEDSDGDGWAENSSPAVIQNLQLFRDETLTILLSVSPNRNIGTLSVDVQYRLINTTDSFQTLAVTSTGTPGLLTITWDPSNQNLTLASYDLQLQLMESSVAVSPLLSLGVMDLLNHLPVIQAISIGPIEEDQPITLQLLNLATDIEDNQQDLAWSVSMFDPAAIESIVWNGSSMVTLNPVANWSGPTVIQFTVTDLDGGLSSTIVTFDWSEVNDPPHLGITEIDIYIGQRRMIPISEIIIDDGPASNLELQLVTSFPGNEITVEGAMLSLLFEGPPRSHNVEILYSDGVFKDQFIGNFTVNVLDGLLVQFEVPELELNGRPLIGDVLEGDHLVIRWNLENLGSLSGVGTLSFKVDDIQLFSTGIDTEPGQFQVGNIEWIAIEGTHQLKIDFDLPGTVEPIVNFSATLVVRESPLRLIGIDDGDRLRGSVVIESYCSCADEIHVWINGSYGISEAHELTEYPYTFVWDTTQTKEGTYHIELDAYNNSQLVGSRALTVETEGLLLLPSTITQVVSGFALWIIFMVVLFGKDHYAEKLAGKQAFTELDAEVASEEAFDAEMIRELREMEKKPPIFTKRSLLELAAVGAVITLGFAVGLNTVLGPEAPYLVFHRSQFIADLGLTAVLSLGMVGMLFTSDWLIARLEGIKTVSYRLWNAGGLVFLISALGLGVPFGFPGKSNASLGPDKEAPPEMEVFRLLGRAFAMVAFIGVGVILALITGINKFGLIATGMGVMLFFFMIIPARHLDAHHIYRHSPLLSIALTGFAGTLFWGYEFELWGGSGPISQGRGLGASAVLSLFGAFMWTFVVLYLLTKRLKMMGQVLLMGVWTSLTELEGTITQVTRMHDEIDLTELGEFDEKATQISIKAWTSLAKQLAEHDWIFDSLLGLEKAAVGIFYIHLQVPLPPRLVRTVVNRKEACVNCHQEIAVTKQFCPHCKRKGPTTSYVKLLHEAGQILVERNEVLERSLMTSQRRFYSLKEEVDELMTRKLSAKKIKTRVGEIHQELDQMKKTGGIIRL